MGAVPGCPSSTDASPILTLQRLVSAYRALSRVAPELSRTAGLIQAGDPSPALLRMRDEIRELMAVLGGSHSHLAGKIGLARSLLRERGLEERWADLVLEASQVSYWWIVGQLAAGGTLDAAQIASCLAAGAAAARAATGLAEQARAAAESPTAAGVYGLLGGALAECGLPLDLFAELDLAEMATRTYMREALRGA